MKAQSTKQDIKVFVWATLTSGAVWLALWCAALLLANLYFAVSGDNWLSKVAAFGAGLIFPLVLITGSDLKGHIKARMWTASWHGGCWKTLTHGVRVKYIHDGTSFGKCVRVHVYEPYRTKIWMPPKSTYWTQVDADREWRENREY